MAKKMSGMKTCIDKISRKAPPRKTTAGKRGMASK